MGITRIRANTQIKAGTIDSTNVKDRSLIPVDFAVYPQVAESMTTAQRDAIIEPATGLMIFNTDSQVLNYYGGDKWVAMVGTTGGSNIDGGSPDSTSGRIIDGGNV